MRRRVVIDALSDRLRRSVGPTAWLLLEELALDSEPSDADGRQAATSVRGLAAGVGMSPNAVARGLRRLRDAGVLDVIQSRDATGVFASGVYRLHLPDGIHVVDPAQPSAVESGCGQLSFAVDP